MLPPVVEITSYSVALELSVVQVQVIEDGAMPVTVTVGTVAVPARASPALRSEARRRVERTAKRRRVCVMP
jgi:hypothetical protein